MIDAERYILESCNLITSLAQFTLQQHGFRAKEIVALSAIMSLEKADDSLGVEVLAKSISGAD